MGSVGNVVVRFECEIVLMLLLYVRERCVYEYVTLSVLMYSLRYLWISVSLLSPSQTHTHTHSLVQLLSGSAPIWRSRPERRRRCINNENYGGQRSVLAFILAHRTWKAYIMWGYRYIRIIVGLWNWGTCAKVSKATGWQFVVWISWAKWRPLNIESNYRCGTISTCFPHLQLQLFILF